MASLAPPYSLRAVYCLRNDGVTLTECRRTGLHANAAAVGIAGADGGLCEDQQGLRAWRVLGWLRRCKLARAFLREYSYEENSYEYSDLYLAGYLKVYGERMVPLKADAVFLTWAQLAWARQSGRA
jgi:hypothetical protein